MSKYTVLDFQGLSKEALQFGFDILHILFEEAKNQRKSRVTINSDTGLKFIKPINPIIPYHTVHEMLVILQKEIDDEKTGKASNPNRCNDCKDFEALEVTVFKKLSGSCSDGPDIPIATDPACEHFKPKED